jgi:hypothetical protein
MVTFNLPDWGVIISLLGFAFMLAGVAGAIYARIGKLEGTLGAKLNGQLKEFCEGTKKNTQDIADIRGDVKVLKEEVSDLKADRRNS